MFCILNSCVSIYLFVKLLLSDNHSSDRDMYIENILGLGLDKDCENKSWVHITLAIYVINAIIKLTYIICVKSIFMLKI